MVKITIIGCSQTTYWMAGQLINHFCIVLYGCNRYQIKERNVGCKLMIVVDIYSNFQCMLARNIETSHS
jgi:hypothetical protein